MKNFEILVKEVKLRPLIGGILSYIPFLYELWDKSRPTGQASSAMYSKSIWEFHFKNFKKFSKYKKEPISVAEFGTGASLGTLVSAIKDGVKNAVGLDLIPYANNYKLNKRIIDELIPKNKFPKLNMNLSIELGNLSNTFSNNRIKYIAPLDDTKLSQYESIDLIFSHSVLEHVDNLKKSYKIMFKLLKKGGLMSHKIDHSSHQITNSWNGHYVLNKFVWKLIRGNKPYLLNRVTPSEHKKLILSVGFKIIHEEYITSNNYDKNSLFLKDDDHLIKTSLFIIEK